MQYYSSVQIRNIGFRPERPLTYVIDIGFDNVVRPPQRRDYESINKDYDGP